jgi:hypothetical protein
MCCSAFCVQSAALARPADESPWILPRIGTRSPWSSKATDILRGVDLPVRRVERGLILSLSGPLRGAPSGVLSVLHDPMIQSVCLQAAELEGVFATKASTALRRCRASSWRQPIWTWVLPCRMTKSTICRSSLLCWRVTRQIPS